MGVKEHFEERVDVTPFGLELLRHSDTDDLATVDLVEIEGAVARAKDLRDVRCEEGLKVVRDGFFYAADLF